MLLIMGICTIAKDVDMSTELCDCFVIRAAARHMSQAYDQFLAPTGLRISQFSILSKLERTGPLTITTLAEYMALDRTTLSRNILPLARKGLISVDRNASDGRAKEVHLTNVGAKRLATARQAWCKAQARFETAFGTEQAADLRWLLRAVVASQFTPAVRVTPR